MGHEQVQELSRAPSALVYADPVRDLTNINATYSRLTVLLQAASKVAKPLRWLMLWSNFRDVRGVVDLDDIRRGKNWRSALVPAESEGELFRSLGENFPDEFFDFGRIPETSGHG